MRIARVTLPALALCLLCSGRGRAENSERWHIEMPDVCKETKVDVALADLTAKDGILKANGTFKASGPVGTVLLEYRIDSDRHQAADGAAISGDWNFEEKFTLCGRHALRVVGYVSVPVGDRHVYCLQNGSFAKRSFVVDCTPHAAIESCTWSCTKGAQAACTGTCTATATGGFSSAGGGYIPYWGLDDKDYVGKMEPSNGPFTSTVSCKPGQRVSFKAKSFPSASFYSEAAEIPCGEKAAAKTAG